jgi:hypothetical protein
VLPGSNNLNNFNLAVGAGVIIGHFRISDAKIKC